MLLNGWRISALVLIIASIQWAPTSAGPLDDWLPVKRRHVDRSDAAPPEVMRAIAISDLHEKLCDRMLGEKMRRDSVEKLWRQVGAEDGPTGFQRRMLDTCPHHSQSPAEVAIRRGDMIALGEMMKFAGAGKWTYARQWLVDAFLDRKVPNIDALYAGRKGKELAKDTGRSVNFVDGQGRTLLHLAVLDGNQLLGLMLLLREPQMIRNAQGRTPVHLAVHMGAERFDFLRLMTWHLGSKELSEVDNDDMTPLQLAIAEQNWPAARLLAARMDAESLAHRNQQQETALVQALKQKATIPKVTIQLLIERMSPEDLSLADAHDMTPLHIACARRLTDISIMLISKQPPMTLSLRSQQFRTPLHFAAALGDLEVTRALAARMSLVDLLAEDAERNTATALAKQYQHPEIMDVLTGAIDRAAFFDNVDQ